MALATKAITPTDTPPPSPRLHTPRVRSVLRLRLPRPPRLTPSPAPSAPSRDRFSSGAVTPPTQREARRAVHASLGVPRVVLLACSGLPIMSQARSATRARARPGAMARPPTARTTIPGASIPPPQSRTEALRQSTQSDPHASAVAVVEAVCGRPVRAATPRCSGGSWPRSTVLHRPGYSAPPPSPGVRGSAVMDVEPSIGRSRPAVPCGPTGANQRSGGRSNPILTSRGSLPVSGADGATGQQRLRAGACAFE